MIRAIIIDDEITGVETIKVLIEKHIQGVKVIATETNPFKATGLIEDYKPDVVFLDIDMPKMDGFQLLDQLTFKDFKLVFTTAHESFAVKAFKINAFDYILKPIDLDDLKACMDKIKSAITHKPEAIHAGANIIELSVSDGIIFVKQEEIIRLEAGGNYTTFFMNNKVRHVVSKKIKEYEMTLNPRLFYRCHRSHIVSLRQVVKMVTTDGLFAQMTDGSMPEIGKANKEEFLKKLKQL